MKHTQRGFTFIEISVVMVIISLLTVGILAGQYLLFQSRLQGLVKDVKNIRMATELFEDYYGGLPGDLLNAVTYWPDDSLYAGFSTANGDGDGDLEDEELRAWQHLGLSGLIHGEYPGALEAAVVEIGNEIPTASFVGTGFYFVVDTVASPPRNAVGFGSGSSIDVINLEGAALTPYNASYIDHKYDDGDPGNGDIRGFNGVGAPVLCFEADTPNEYNLQDDDKACYLWFYFEG